MSKIFITGGAGFIGREVAKELIRRKHKVISFDLMRANMLEGSKRYSFYVGSILDPYQLSKAMRNCDYVLHLAAALGVQRTEINRLECMFINIQGTVNVLDSCIKEKIKKIIFVSSSEVYGESGREFIDENTPLNPKSNYAISKIAGEEYLRAYYDTYGLKYNIVRLFNIYGERQREDFVIPKFVKNIMQNKPPVVYGRGDQIRCFCYVKDAAIGIVDALFSRLEKQTFNIGNDTEPTSIKDLANKVISVSKKRLKPKFISYSDSDRDLERDIIRRVPSVEKARKMLNYKPAVSLEKGITKIVDFYKNKYKE